MDHLFARVERFIYQVIPRTKTKAFLQSLIYAPKPPSFYASHVQAICFCHISYFHPDTLVRLFTVCTGLTNIACWHDMTVLTGGWDSNKVAALPLVLHPQILSACMRSFFGGGLKNPDFRLPFLSHITHLRIIDQCYDWIHWSGIELLPWLTHIAVKVEIGMLTDWEIIANRVTTILSCRTLKVFICLYPGSYAAKVTGGRLSQLVNDIRIVHLLIPQEAGSDWEDGAQGRPDMWYDAEEAQKQQQRGKSEYFALG
jgi:hypothetical protein